MTDRTSAEKEHRGNYKKREQSKEKMTNSNPKEVQMATKRQNEQNCETDNELQTQSGKKFKRLQSDKNERHETGGGKGGKGGQGGSNALSGHAGEDGEPGPGGKGGAGGMPAVSCTDIRPNGETKNVFRRLLNRFKKKKKTLNMTEKIAIQDVGLGKEMKK